MRQLIRRGLGFTCNLCGGRLEFDEDDEVTKNTCVCEDNPIGDEGK